MRSRTGYRATRVCVPSMWTFYHRQVVVWTWSKSRCDEDQGEVSQVGGSTQGEFRYRTASAARYLCCGSGAWRWVINEDMSVLARGLLLCVPSLLAQKQRTVLLPSLQYRAGPIRHCNNLTTN